LDKVIKIWDIRSTKQPLALFQGHVPDSTLRCKRIHHPTFYNTTSLDSDCDSFVLTGGERSHSLSMFKHNHHSNGTAASGRSDAGKSSSSFYSRGKLPVDSGDAGCIAVNGDKVAVSVEDGEIIILAPS
jgi:hypothetical protein